MPKIGSSEPEDQPAEDNLRNGRRKNELAQQPLRIGACRKAEAVNPKANHRAESPKRCVPKSGSSEPEGQPAQRKPESKRPPRAAKTTQDERSPSAGRSRETRGRRSSADTPTNTIEKRDCDTLRPSEASQKVFHHSKSGASEGREEAKKIAEVVVTTWEQIAESPKFSTRWPKNLEKLRVSALSSARRFAERACRERLPRLCKGLIAPRGRERKQFAPTRPQIRNKTAFLLVGLDKDAYICSSDPPAVHSSSGFAWRVRRRRGVVHDNP